MDAPVPDWESRSVALDAADPCSFDSSESGVGGWAAGVGVAGGVAGDWGWAELQPLTSDTVRITDAAVRSSRIIFISDH